MNYFKHTLAIFLTGLSLGTCAASNTITSYFESIKSDPNALYTFFRDMPKGGELHYHLSGSSAPETMLTLAEHGNFCIDRESSAINQTMGHCDGTGVAELENNPEQYQHVIRAWSMQDFIPGKESGHDHFFATFSKFHSVVSAYKAKLLAEIMQRAADQHESYMEIMIPSHFSAANDTPFINDAKNLTDIQHALLEDKNFQNSIVETVASDKHLLNDARHELGCDTDTPKTACKLVIKFQYQVYRDSPLDMVFAQALQAFAAADRSDDVVGVNLVQDENNIVSLRDYHEQMQIFKYLHREWPRVHIALHAGELSQQTTPSGSLRFHIRDAINTGHAERIGHGVSIAFEDNAKATLQKMASKPVPVEINLSSNKAILNIGGKQHPLGYYLDNHVPVVLSTDDEGILRTDLTWQYVEAAFEHHLNYPTIKTINRNALTYSFLPGKSLWANAEKGIPVTECKNLASASCQQFITGSEKARLQWELESNLKAFEERWTASQASVKGKTSANMIHVNAG